MALWTELASDKVEQFRRLQCREKALKPKKCPPSGGGLSPIDMSATWRKISVRRTTGTEPDEMTSANTRRGPTEGS